VVDNDLIRLFLPIITAGLTAAGYAGVIVKQSNQPTQQGVPTAPTVFFSKVGDHRYGFLQRSDEWDEDEELMVHTEVQAYETTFQISALALQDPADTSLYTASDLVNEVAAIMQSDATRETLKAGGVYILRVQDVTNPYFVDDGDNFEAMPSFDFILSHKQTRVSAVPVVESTEFNIDAV